MKIAVFSLRKRPKAEEKISPKILLEKNKERENRKSEEKETRRRKTNNGCMAFMLKEKKPFEVRALFLL